MKSSVNEYAKLIGANAEFDVDHSWFFVDEDLSPHHHAHVPIVSAFYIQAENDQSTKRKFSSPIGDLVMLDPRGGVNLYCRPPANQAPGETRTGRNSTFNGSGCYNVTPGTGTILHFPGYLIHYVCQNITKNPRIVIGVNWERVIDLSKLDKSIPHTPRAIPLSHTQTNTSNHFKDYLSNKNIKV
jgi:hypothetical protein